MEHNIILMADSYKTSQFVQYPPNTEVIYSYAESRGGEYDKTVVVGIELFCKKYLSKPITKEDIDFAEMIITKHTGTFNREGWEYILEEYSGYLPVSIYSVPSGTVVDGKNVLFVIQNTDDNCFWLTSYLETALLRAIWYPTTVATLSYHVRETILKYLNLTGTPETIPYKLVDFGSRGVSSKESGELGGMGHLVCFDASDNLEATTMIYNMFNKSFAGCSIPASEHSTITSWTREEELEAYRNMIKQFGGKYPMFACVSDSYNIWAALKLWKELEPEIIASGSTLVVRPDSGDPIQTPIKVIMELMELFGYTYNSKGYKVLPDYIRVIQGDGIGPKDIEEILFQMAGYGLSADNISFGMGGGLLQSVNRDTLKFAMKCSHAYVNGEGREVFKDPITDKGKASKKGKVWLFKDKDGNFVTKNLKKDSLEDLTNKLFAVYYEGQLHNVISDFDTIRQNAGYYNYS